MQMSDNELDNLFKEAAEGFNPPQDNAAWEQMAARLDKTPAPAPGFWNWKSLSVITATGLIVVTGMLWLTVPSGTETDSEVISKTHEKNGVDHATQNVAQEQEERTGAAGKTNRATAQLQENADGRTHTVIQPEPKGNDRTAGKQSSDAEKKDAGSASSPQPVPSGKPVNPVFRESYAAQPDVITSEVNLSRDQGLTPASLPKENHASAPSDSVEQAQEVPQDSVDTITDAPAEKPEQGKAKGVVSLKAVVSPDFSSVNFFSAGKTGINYGLLVGYAFNNRWSVYTGVISSKKLYATREAEGSYAWDGHNYPVKKLDGDCRILDIPVNVYYTFFPERFLSLRVGAGFSSYIMRKEDYVYCVDNYGSDVYYEQKVRGENNEWFKVLNVSVVVSKRFSPRFAAEVEPFVKVPLAGVGEGKVTLVSMGAFFNVKFDLTNNK